MLRAAWALGRATDIKDVLLLRYYLITTFQYSLRHIITKSSLPDYYLLLHCYYINTTVLLVQYYPITTYEYQLLCINTKPLLHDYYHLYYINTTVLLMQYYPITTYEYPLLFIIT